MATHPDYPGATSNEKKGRLYWRYRASRAARPIALKGQPGSAEFEASYNDAIQGVQTPVVVAMPGSALPKTFGAARRILETTRDWRKLGASSQLNSNRYLDRFLAMPFDPAYRLPWKDTPVAKMTFKNLEKLILDIEEAEGPIVAKAHLFAVKKLLKVAKREDWIEYNPSAEIVVSIPKTDGHKPWPREVMEKYEARHPIGSQARTTYALAMWLGNRRSDVATLGWDDIKNSELELDGDVVDITAFEFRQQKNRSRNGGREMFLPILKWLSASLAPLPKDTPAILVNRFGQPYSLDGLSVMMIRWGQQAGIPRGYTIHGLRKSLGIKLAELGLSSRQIQEVLGHYSLAATEVYVRLADKKKLSVQSFQAVHDHETRREQRLAGRAARPLKLVSK